VGTSTIALLVHGSRNIVGVDIDTERIERGRTILATTPYRSSVRLLAVPDTRALPFEDGAFRFALANAVIEHIPQPRDAHLRELWRVVAPRGHLMISETPNKYVPKDIHTTGLWFNQWLPKLLAYRRALQRGRFEPHRTDWDSSGWRGAGYYEVAPQLAGAVLIPEQERLRHRLFARLGIPASILDPYPIWVFQKLR